MLHFYYIFKFWETFPSSRYQLTNNFNILQIFLLLSTIDIYVKTYHIYGYLYIYLPLQKKEMLLNLYLWHYIGIVLIFWLVYSLEFRMTMTEHECKII